MHKKNKNNLFVEKNFYVCKNSNETEFANRKKKQIILKKIVIFRNSNKSRSMPDAKMLI